jgi:SAM-dependent methyltransferase
MSKPQPNYAGLAEDYSRNRPQYPQRMVANLRDLLPDGPLRVADIGAGTGISARLLAKLLGDRAAVTGIEPDDGMRRRAEEDTSEATIDYVTGTAETLDFDDDTFDLIFVGQAIHWFDRPSFFAAAGRQLKPGGVLAIAGNHRDWRRSDFLTAYEAFQEEHNPGFSRYDRELDLIAEFEALDWVGDTAGFREEWIRPMKIPTFLGMAHSSSKVRTALEALGEAEGERQIRAIIEPNITMDGFLVLPYWSDMFCASKKP